jgi:hypothetical protein
MPQGRKTLTEPTADERESGRSSHRRVELVTTVALALCTLVAVTAVSIGIARADVPGSEPQSASFALALFIGLLLSGMGALTAAMAEHRQRD